MIRWIVAGVLLLLVAGYYKGYGWRLEWDTRSGKQRTIHEFFGHQVGSPDVTATTLSEWRSTVATEENWIVVSAGPGPGRRCYPDVLNHLKRVESIIKDGDQRQYYSGWILDELEASQDICELGEHCSKVTKAMNHLHPQFHLDASLSEEQLRRLWAAPESAQQVAAWNPSTDVSE